VSGNLFLSEVLICSSYVGVCCTCRGGGGGLGRGGGGGGGTNRLRRGGVGGGGWKGDIHDRKQDGW
jgi:hypothetical protein